MKKLVITALCVLVFYFAYAQKPPVKFGDVSMEELKMSRYDSDTSAAAVVLADFGETELSYNTNKGWQLSFERHTRIKILNKGGYEWADFSVPLYHTGNDRETLSGLKAVTYNLENGKIAESKLKNDGTFEEKSSENIDLVKFTLPNVKEGSVIEVTYKVSSVFIFNFQDWEFQSTIPVKWSEYRARIPEYFTYDRYMQGYVPLAINETKSKSNTISFTANDRSGGVAGSSTAYQNDVVNYLENIHRWVCKDVPAFKDEPFMTSRRDYVSKINFELASYKFADQPNKQYMGTWGDLNKSFLENEYFGKAIKGSGALKNIAEEVTGGLATQQEKTAAIYNYVKSTIVWNGEYRKYVDNSLKKVIEEKKGSSADINLLLVSLLQKAGINANPVIISTRNHGFIRENMAISSQFNYVICQVLLDGKSLLLDATDRLLPINILPERCLNGKGYIISEETPGWISLTAPKSKLYASADVTLNPEGQLKGKMTISNDGYFGYKMRSEYLKKGEEEYVKDFSHRKSWEVDKTQFDNVKNLGEAVNETYEFTHLDNTGDASVIYINPLLHLRQSENPFKLQERQYPVDFGSAMDQTFVCKLTVPENYQAEEVPVSKVMALPNNAGKYVYNVQQHGNTINITSLLTINQSLFSQLEYKALREFYGLVVAKQAEQIVLKKKN